MGNQALVPSQIQSVENYLIDLKTYIQFRSSLGSTTFMKTAKVNLIDNSLEDATNYNIISSSSVTSSSNLNDPLLANANSNLINSGASVNSNSGPNQSQNSNLNTSTLNMNSSSVSSATSSGLNKANLVKQKLQQLRESQQVVVVKIFPKYDLSIRLDLYSKRIKEIKSIIQSRYGMSTNCLPCSEFIITDRAAFLFRQFIRYNLYDRISTRPFLTLVEKKWITFQLLCAVNEIHSLQIVHGDIKAENVLVNSFLWVSLTDFASYKPVYLSKNHPTADFNYYFDISRRRTCYLAPERLDSTRSDSFREKTQPAHGQNQNLAEHEAMYEVMPPDPNDFKPSMDVFGLGCVIAELFMERPLFDFAHLLAYRERKYDPSGELANEIGDKNILDMLAGMLSLNEHERKSVNEYLQEQNDKAFPSYFVFLKNYISRFISVALTADEIVIRLKNDLPILLKNFKLNLNENMSSSSSMSEDGGSMAFSKSASSNKDGKKSENTNDAFLILLSLLLSSVRKIKFTENKLIAIELMKTFSKFLDDSIILERIVPYYLILLEDQPNQTQSPIVKSHVIYALNDCLSNIYKIDVQNLNIFPEIIFECLEQLSKDDSFLVRSAVAKTISSFALTSLRYLDTVFLTKRSFLANDSSNLNTSQSNSSQNISSELETEVEHAKMSRLNAAQSDFSTYDKEYEAYQAKLTEIVMHLMTDTSSNAVKETLIHSDISKLCSFFSRQKTSEFLLPHMITMLNEKTDWSVRAAFFDALCPVLTCIGWESVEIVKSLLEQGLRDSEEFVIYRTLLTLGRMVQVGLLDRQQICYFLNNHIAPLLCHPSLWIRHGAVSYISTVCKQKNTKLINGLNTADVLCSVAPILAKFLERKDLINYDREEILFSCLKKPIRRAVYDCISQDGSSDQLFIYLNQRSEIRCLTNFNYLPGYVDCADPSVQRFFEKLCKLGFIEEDEDKLLHLKEFMDKTRISRLSSSLHNADMSASNNSTTSVLNASSANLKENFSLKDGYINIMKEKFQRCNCEYLNVRRESLFAAEDSSKREKNASNKLDESPTTAIASSAPQTEASYNNEWKVMFGKSSSEPQAEPKQAGLTRQRSLVGGSPGAHKQRLAHFNQQLSARKYDCTMEVERYLDRMTFFYDEHALKRNKALKLKESINASISSNSICLSSSIGKWKPKGYLILHSNEHTKEINKLSRNSDSTYFSTCSTSESCVKIWSTDNLLDAKSGFFKSIFTYDRQNSQDASMTRPCCTTFYNKNSLAILCEDFRFYVIDFNSNRTQYRLYSNEKLFKSNTCKSLATYNEQGVHKQSSPFDKTSFFYLNKAYKSSASATNKCGPRSCSCSSNYPVDMIRIDDSSPSWPLAATNSYDYFVGARGSSVKSLFCYSTSSGDVSCIDMRTRTKAFELKRDLRKGYVTSMVTDPCYTWIGMGTSSGDIEIYDFRFMLPVKRFEHHFKSAVVRLCNHPMSANRIVASYQGNNEIAVWNMENSSSSLSGSGNKAAYDPEFVFWGEQSVPPLCQKKTGSPYIKYVSGLIGCSAGEQNGTNGLICASTDMKMRYIDLNEQNKESYVISSAFNFQQNVKSAELNAQAGAASSSTSSKSEFANSLMSQSVSYETRQIEGTKVLLEQDQQFNSGQKYSINNSNLASTSFSYNSPALTHQSYFTHHQDAITDLVVCYSPLNNKNHPLIVTSARDGALKIWR